MPSYYAVYCAACAQDIHDGDAHIIVSPAGAEHHALYCSACCPADHTQPGHLMAQLTTEDVYAGRARGQAA